MMALLDVVLELTTAATQAAHMNVDVAVQNRSRQAKVVNAKYVGVQHFDSSRFYVFVVNINRMKV